MNKHALKFASRLSIAAAIGLVFLVNAWQFAPATSLRADEIQLVAPPRHLAQIVCGRDIIRTEVIAIPPPGWKLVAPVAVAAQAGGGLTIVLNTGPTLAANADALAAFQSAATIWESWINDPVTVVIDADLAALDPGVLGATGSRSLSTDYTSVRDAMVADAQVDEGVLSLLPTVSQYDVILPVGFTLANDLTGTKANFRALGFDVSFDDAFADATITFSTGFLAQFDFDPSDGISPGQFDFEAIIVHEIGHALGFISVVDEVDFFMSTGQFRTVRLRPLDMFRFRPGDGGSDFTLNPRIGVPGSVESVQKFFQGRLDLGLSTGFFGGDGHQASHWKADDITGVTIGVMDPTLSPGVRDELTFNDLRAFGLIGWDIEGDCNGNGVPDGLDIANLAAEDCNANGIPDECDIDPTDPDENGEVSLDDNDNGIPDECELDDCGNGIIDAGEECDGGLGCTACFCVATFEPTVPPSPDCQPICGNGNLDQGEACDGTNNDTNCPDRCLADCTCEPLACGDAAAGDCCEGNGTIACADTACCETVCACDPFCCNTEWDVNCAGPNEFEPGCSALDLCSACQTGCGNGILDQGEECDGIASDACPDQCLPDCTCPSLDPPLAGPGTHGRTLEIIFSSLTSGAAASAAAPTAFRVTLVTLYDPGDPQPVGQPDYSGSEGEVRYLNLLRNGDGTAVTDCVSSAAQGTTYPCVSVGCTAEFVDWGALFRGVTVYVSGNAIIPDSQYTVAHLGPSCTVANAATCADVSVEVPFATSRFGDSQPDGLVAVADVVKTVDAVKQLPSSVWEYQVYVRDQNPVPHLVATGVGDIVAHVDALKLTSYLLPINSCP